MKKDEEEKAKAIQLKNEQDIFNATWKDGIKPEDFDYENKPLAVEKLKQIIKFLDKTQSSIKMTTIIKGEYPIEIKNILKNLECKDELYGVCILEPYDQKISLAGFVILDDFILKYENKSFQRIEFNKISFKKVHGESPIPGTPGPRESVDMYLNFFAEIEGFKILSYEAVNFDNNMKVNPRGRTKGYLIKYEMNEFKITDSISKFRNLFIHFYLAFIPFEKLEEEFLRLFKNK